jgi:mannose-6-phosphate isomerase-like protein (cupin superfamily)
MRGVVTGLTAEGRSTVGSAAAPVAGAFRASYVAMGPNLTSPMHHDTNVGIGVVVSGSVQLVLEEGSVRLGPGDMLVNPGVEQPG